MTLTSKWTRTLITGTAALLLAIAGAGAHAAADKMDHGKMDHDKMDHGDKDKKKGDKKEKKEPAKDPKKLGQTVEM